MADGYSRETSKKTGTMQAETKAINNYEDDNNNTNTGIQVLCTDVQIRASTWMAGGGGGATAARRMQSVCQSAAVNR